MHTQAESLIVNTLLARLLNACKATISVSDGEETTLVRSDDREAIIEAMFSTDSDVLIIHREGKRDGSILLIYGNGWDLISDYSVSLEEVIEPINKLITSWESFGHKEWCGYLRD